MRGVSSFPQCESIASYDVLTKYRSKHCAIIFTVLLFFVHAGAARADSISLSDYWTLRNFIEQHPAQAGLTHSFSERVVGTPAPVNVDLDRPARIAVVYPGIQASDYWRRSVSSLEARLTALGVPHVIDTHFTRPGSEVRRQAVLINDALRQDPDYLIFTLDAFRHRVIIERLIARGRPKVILQNVTTPLRAWRLSQPFLYVGFDHAEGTRLLIDHILSGEDAPKKIAILYGPRGYVSSARGDTFRSAALSRAKTEIVASYYVGFDRENAREATESLLRRHPEVDFIYACATDIALGAVDALRELDRTRDVRLNGWGGGIAELDLVATGALEATVMRMNDDNGVAMAEAIALDLAGRGDEVPQVYSGDFALVTPDLAPEQLAALKRRAFRYSQ